MFIVLRGTTFTFLFTLGLVKLIKSQVIRAIKYGNVPRKLIKKKETKKSAFSEIRLFLLIITLENHLLELHEIWHENTLGNIK